LGDPAKAKRQLGWTPQVTPQEMCAEMVTEDIKIAQRHVLLQQHGLDLPMTEEN
jgi:GDPmannose 4,6-dehydratase